MRGLSLLATLVLLASLVMGCQPSEQTMEQMEKKTVHYGQKMQPITPVSQKKWHDLEKSFLRYPGKYSGDRYDQSKVKQELARLSSDMSETQILEKVYSLIAEDYRKPIQQFNALSTEVGVERTPGVNEMIFLPEQKKVHFSILLDASGSMNGEVNGKSKMEAAKEAVREFARKLPQNAEISLRVYGHKGSSDKADKSLSCNSTEEIYSSEGYNVFDHARFDSALNQVKASGWTPIAKALQSVQQDTHDQTTDSYVYIVSDGEETCDGDPVKAAQELNRSKAKTIVNIIGFDVHDKGQQQLQAVANAGNGQYVTVENQQALQKYLDQQYDQLKKQWQQWISDNKQAADQQGDQITKKIRQINKEMDKIKRLEEDHFRDSVNVFLQDKSQYKGVQKLFIDRQNLINRYAYERATELRNQVVGSETEEKGQIDKEGKEKLTETGQKKGQ